MNRSRSGTPGCRMPGERQGRGQRGYSMFELVCVIVVVSLLILVMLDRTLRYQAMAEKSSMELTIRNMRSGLNLRVAELMMAERADEIGKLVEENPINWLEKPPPNYLGEIHNPQFVRLPPDTWYFDPDRRQLVYMLRRNRFFGADPADGKPVILRVTAVRRASPTASGGPQKLEGVALIRVSEAR